MSDKLRFGILGTGNIARQFAAGVAGSNRCAVTAVGSRNATTAADFARAYQIPHAHKTYEDLLADPSCDAIYLSLPNTMHHEWAIKSLRAGKHVLCEKPISVTADQAYEMFEVARSCGRILIEAFMYRAHPQTQKAIEIARSGVIGNINLIRTSFCYRVRKTDGNIRFNPVLAGGALMDVGCYCLNFSRLFANSEPIDLHAVSTCHSSGVDVQTTVIARFPGDIHAEFTVGMMTQTDNTALVCGDEGYIRIPIPWKPPIQNAEVIVQQSIPPRQDNPSVTPATPVPTIYRINDPRPLYGIEADAFADCVLDSHTPFVSAEDTIGNMKCLDKIRGLIESSSQRV